MSNDRATSPRIIVIIPAWNEEATVGGVVTAVRRQLPEEAILVVDDGSTDGTAAMARSAGAEVARLPHNLGIGGAVQTGFRYARANGYDIAVQVDADGQHPAEEIPKLLAAMKETAADVVVGSRFIEDTGYRPDLARKVGIVLFARLLSLICGQRLTDTTSGFRAANRLAIGHLAEMYACDYPEVESLVALHGAGYRIAETSARMLERTEGSSSIGLWKGSYYIVKVVLAVLVDAVAKPMFTRAEMEALAADSRNVAAEPEYIRP